MTKTKLFLVCVFIICAIGFFCYTVEQDQEVSNKSLVHSNTLKDTDSHLYYMTFENNDIVIYNKDHSVYEFTDLEKDLLPDSLIHEIQGIKYFKDQQELYEFLETYTS